MASLTLNNVKKRFGQIEVLKGIDIAIDDGDFLVLVGPSGCGKSTLLNMIAGLDSISDGDVMIGDNMINTLHPADRDIAMVFQSYALYPNMTVAQNISFGLEMRHVPKPERERLIGDVSAMLQIEHLLKRKPGQLSGGQRQRVAMGRALVRDPKIFLFDEPLSNLDAKLRVDMRTEIKRLHQRLNATIVYVTHDQIEAMTLATKIAVMKDGEVQQLGSPAEVYDNPANTFVATFMGSPSMNLFDAKVEASDSSKTQLEIHGHEGEAQVVSYNRGFSELASYVGKTVSLGVRPEDISDQKQGGEGTLLCKVDVTEPTGADTYVITLLSGKEVVARMPANANLKPGDITHFAFNPEKLVLFDRETGMRIR
ncbi:sugar ABC transporter ATP-binding protein [Enterovibrio norvegicus FF-162]|uniref:Sugar ABC transporter ATP-binding protein n=1 Tax=Enterovibrio norvegicus FF-454 TaxID=1185651 RepID=A0A1E5BZ15_9GAMM|nr:sn-glycerol-3-phosphate ABC transporter ATP-binding protein UgpC [Enterovibrio norvegicus]OEE58483.1 sugar ABC transporter ATP-binding protein [Enterovibrio norvegicus FF-454]OEE84601.1 sugar ABC transporter ATP-binding protein [Enterovibrio norvegicus FF-162]